MNQQKQSMMNGIAALGTAAAGLGAINNLSGVTLGDENPNGSGSPTFNDLYSALYPSGPFTLLIGGNLMTCASIPQMLGYLADFFTVRVAAIPDVFPPQPNS